LKKNLKIHIQSHSPKATAFNDLYFFPGVYLHIWRKKYIFNHLLGKIKNILFYSINTFFGEDLLGRFLYMLKHILKIMTLTHYFKILWLLKDLFTLFYYWSVFSPWVQQLKIFKAKKWLEETRNVTDYWWNRNLFNVVCPGYFYVNKWIKFYAMICKFFIPDKVR
jgi:hypothetical protein